MLSVLVVDNHPAIRVAAALTLSAPPAQFVVVGECASVDDVDWKAPVPDLVVLDLYLGRDDTVSTPHVPRFVERGSQVVLYTSETRPVPLRRAMASGVAGIALKDDDLNDLRASLLACARGDFACTTAAAHALLSDESLVAALTDRELEVISAVDDGLTHQQIGRRLDIAVSTVRAHLKAVRRKYLELGRDVTNTTSLVREAVREGWIDRRRG